MMGRQDGQMRMIITDIDSFVPDDHLLRKISKAIDWGFIYEAVAPYYSKLGRPGIDPVLQIKMLLIGYLYGIKSERRLEEEVNFNLAYRWFCELDLDRKSPDHSVFSQNRRRRFTDESVYRKIFCEVLLQLIEKKLVTGKNVVSDGTFVPANVASCNRIKVKSEIENSAISYLDELDKELQAMPGYVEPKPEVTEKETLKNTTDMDCGFIDQPNKNGFGYTAQVTVDTEHGIIVGVDVTPANRPESENILRHVKRIEDTINIGRITLDGAYDIGAVHRGFELLGIESYSALRNYHNNPMKSGFSYDRERDVFICPEGNEACFKRLTYKKTNRNYSRKYVIERKTCADCDRFRSCDHGGYTINASPFYPSFFDNMRRVATEAYSMLMRLRSIWSEGTFSVLKREHNMDRASKRGVSKVTEECLLSATALNLKRMVKALG